MRGKKNGDGTGSKGGYRPLNEGYSAIDKRGYAGKGSATQSPKAPQGGTGKTSSGGAKPSDQSTKK
jgi:hypothetical protein